MARATTAMSTLHRFVMSDLCLAMLFVNTLSVTLDRLVLRSAYGPHGSATAQILWYATSAIILIICGAPFLRTIRKAVR